MSSYINSLDGSLAVDGVDPYGLLQGKYAAVYNSAGSFYPLHLQQQKDTLAALVTLIYYEGKWYQLEDLDAHVSPIAYSWHGDGKHLPVESLKGGFHDVYAEDGGFKSPHAEQAFKHGRYFPLLPGWSVGILSCSYPNEFDPYKVASIVYDEDFPVLKGGPYALSDEQQLARLGVFQHGNAWYKTQPKGPWLHDKHLHGLTWGMMHKFTQKTTVHACTSDIADGHERVLLVTRWWLAKNEHKRSDPDTCDCYGCFLDDAWRDDDW